MSWPPQLSDLKDELDIDPSDTRDDDRLQRYLDAAVTFVERVRRNAFKVDPETGEPIEPRTPVAKEADTLQLGTLRLASRWNTRRRSPDGLIAMAEMGVGRVSSFDPDIDRLLRLGRHAKAVVG